MIPTDNSDEMLSVYADWLEDQDINTDELREFVNLKEINQWHWEFIANSHAVGSGVNKIGTEDITPNIVVCGIHSCRCGGDGYHIVGGYTKGLGQI